MKFFFKLKNSTKKKEEYFFEDFSLQTCLVNFCSISSIETILISFKCWFVFFNSSVNFLIIDRSIQNTKNELFEILTKSSSIIRGKIIRPKINITTNRRIKNTYTTSFLSLLEREERIVDGESSNVARSDSTIANKKS